MLKLPVTPQFVVAIIHASQILIEKPIPQTVVCEVVAILALAEEGDIWRRPAAFRRYADTLRASWRHPSGDHVTSLIVWRAYQQQVKIVTSMPDNKRRQHLEAWCDRESVMITAFQAAEKTYKAIGHALWWSRPRLSELLLGSIFDDKFSQKIDLVDVAVRKALLRSFFMNVAVKFQKEYRNLLGDQPGLVTLSSALAPQLSKWVMYNEYIDPGHGPYFSGVSSIDPNWLFEDDATAAYMEVLLADPYKKNWYPVQMLRKAKDAFDLAKAQSTA